MIAVINYGLGNLTSIQNMFRRLGIDAVITDDKQKIRDSSKILLPGVGHFKRGMANLNETGMTELLNEEVAKGKPLLGICLGAQLMTKHSEEGDIEGLGWVDANTVRFNVDSLPVPHMGWADVIVQGNNPLWIDLPTDPRFYFVHAYHFKFDDTAQVAATANYGYEFACAFQKDNVFGTQFHPEKSHKFGMKVLENFNKIAG